MTRHGPEAGVVLGVEDYRELTGKGTSRRSLVELLLGAPKVPGGLVEVTAGCSLFGRRALG